MELEGLQAWMDRRELGSGPITDARRLGGGTQNILLRFTRGEREFVLRRPPEALRANSNETMLREARVLEALAGTEVPHPGLIAVCDDPAVLGAAFYLMEPIEGFSAVEAMPPPHRDDPNIRHRMGLALAEAAARIAQVDYRARGLESLGRADGFIERQVPRWAGQLESYGRLQGWPGPAALAGVAEVGHWLQARQPRSFQPGLMHGDLHIANVMYRPHEGEIAAVVDWELATIGAPLLDLGWLLATWPDPDRNDDGPLTVEPWDGFPAPAELVQAYGASSGLDLADLGWWRVMACYKLAILLEGGFARACAGLAPADVGERLHERSLRLVERAQTWMAQ